MTVPDSGSPAGPERSDDELVGLIVAFGAAHDPAIVDELARRHVRDAGGWCAWCGVHSDGGWKRWPCRPALVVRDARRAADQPDPPGGSGGPA